MAFMALCVASGAFAQTELAPLRNQGVRGAIPNRYIVVMKPGVSREAMGDIRQRITGMGGKILHVYTSALNGFSLEISPEGLQALRALSGVDYIEVDQLGSGGTLQPPSPAGVPPSGIDRIDRRFTPLNGTYSYSETGAGVTAYIIDSGIRATHSDFGGRARDRPHSSRRQVTTEKSSSTRRSGYSNGCAKSMASRAARMLSAIPSLRNSSMVRALWTLPLGWR